MRPPALKIQAFPSIGPNNPGIESEPKVIFHFRQRSKRIIEESAEIGYPPLGGSFGDIRGSRMRSPPNLVGQEPILRIPGTSLCSNCQCEVVTQTPSGKLFIRSRHFQTLITVRVKVLTQTTQQEAFYPATLQPCHPAVSTILAHPSGSRLAPPTSTPLTSLSASRLAMFFSFTLPP